MAAITKADANPTKAFFVRMITRDIALEDCILDLLDNSVDSAWELEGGRPSGLDEGVDLSAYRIEIVANGDRFRMTDNCGGITLDQAAKYAFTFGRKDDAEIENYSIGVYGIGMKRAVFKIGERISITSTYRSHDAIEAFRVPIDVKQWLDDESHSWDFDIEQADPFDAPGVEIEISNLIDGSKNSFGNPLYIQNLRRTIARDYALHLHRGLVVVLNGEQIKGWNIEVRSGGDFEPMRSSYTEEFDGVEVRIEILAGMAAPPPESSEPDEGERRDERSGWYIICNGRIVLAADRSAVSGWGTDAWPQWHPQYAGFLGLIFFTSERASALPLTTTKRSVDVSAPVFRQARPKMREASRSWIDYTNARKQGLDAARTAESQAKPVSIFAVIERPAVGVPVFTPKPRVQIANINYAVPLTKLRALAQGLGDINLSYRDVGLKSFEYAYDDLVGDE